MVTPRSLAPSLKNDGGLYRVLRSIDDNEERGCHGNPSMAAQWVFPFSYRDPKGILLDKKDIAGGKKKLLFLLTLDPSSKILVQTRCSQWNSTMSFSSSLHFFHDDIIRDDEERLELIHPILLLFILMLTLSAQYCFLPSESLMMISTRNFIKKLRRWRMTRYCFYFQLVPLLRVS